MNQWTFGAQTVKTKVYMVMPETPSLASVPVQTSIPQPRIDIRLESIRSIRKGEDA